MGTDHPHLKHLRLFDHQQREVATQNLVMDVQWNVARFTSHAAMEISGGSGTASPTPPFFGDVRLSPVAGGKVQLACKAGPPAGSPSPLPPSTPSLTVTAGLGPDPGAITFEFTSGGKSLGSLVWVPTANTPFSGQVGDTQVTIEWSQTSPDAQAVLTLSIATPLPPTQPNVLLLDATYPQITAPSYVVIDGAPRPAPPRPRRPRQAPPRRALPAPPRSRRQTPPRRAPLRLRARLRLRRPVPVPLSRIPLSPRSSRQTRWQPAAMESPGR